MNVETASLVERLENGFISNVGPKKHDFWPKSTYSKEIIVCLFKGGVVVLHTCLTNRIRICRVPRGPITPSTRDAPRVKNPGGR